MNPTDVGAIGPTQQHVLQIHEASADYLLTLEDWDPSPDELEGFKCLCLGTGLWISYSGLRWPCLLGSAPHKPSFLDTVLLPHPPSTPPPPLGICHKTSEGRHGIGGI